jgi:hypothetical protein
VGPHDRASEGTRIAVHDVIGLLGLLESGGTLAYLEDHRGEIDSRSSAPTTRIVIVI